MTMRKIRCGAMLVLALLALGPRAVSAQTLASPTVNLPAVPSLTIPSMTTPSLTLPGMPAQHLTAGHAMALGLGLFTGAVAGTVLLNGGALATVVGAVAGLAVGNWAWLERDID